MKLLRSLVLVLAVATTAQADVWKKATEPTPQLDFYEAAMSAGDELALAANARSINLATIIKTVDSAVEKYKAAAKARPTAAEPWFRIASVLNSFFFDCSDLIGQRNLPATCHLGRAVGHRGQETLDAWDKFESLAPLDPRVNEVLLARALLRTKLVGETTKPEKLLRGAAADYIALLDREDGLYQTSKEMVLGNLAETQMMLGEFESSIETYKQAIRMRGGISAIYGLAVTLDRDNQTELAFRAIKSLPDPENAFAQFERKLMSGEIFFVPAGEEEYYFALAHEALGNFEQSIVHWRAFIRSGAHPQFQPRAKEHLDKLMARKNLKIKVPITPDLEEFPSPIRRRK